jgi:transposase
MVNDLHYKAITKLMKYPTIYIPKLTTKRMLEENTLTGSTKRLLQMESHGKLIRRLQEKAEEKGVKIELVTEFMTTKTCSSCFTINDPKANKIYKCSECNSKCDRDMNASKNIYMQVISKILTKLL